MHWQNSAEFGPNFHLYRTGTVLMYGTTPPLYEYTVRVYWSTLLAEFYQRRKPTTRSHQDDDMMMIINNMMMMTTLR